MKKVLFAVAFVATAAATQAQAQGPAAPLVGDPTAGKAKTETCAACHGPEGNSQAPNFPKLAGQSARYALKQLQDIKSGERVVPEMMGLLDGFTDQDLADLAAYFATQTITVSQADPALAERGETIYRGGISDKGVPACAACHAPDGVGNALAGYPSLAGQHASYIAETLRKYRAGADGDESGRDNDGDTAQMRMIASRLSDSEIAAVASFVSGLY